MLETERLVLRPWRVSDAAVQHELWSERDPRVPAHRRLDAEGRPTADDLEERIRAGASPGLLAIEVRATGEVVGYCGLVDGTHGNAGEPELAFELLRRAWGRGYATEAASAVVDAARLSGTRRLWATVRAWNVASFRVLDKLGFVITDRVDPDAAHGDSIFTRKDLSPVALRRAEARDAERVAAIAEAAYSPYLERLPDGARPGPLDADYAAAIAEHETWALDLDGEVIGYLVLVPSADHLLLENVAVHPDAQGRGFGGMLLDHAEERAAAHGLTRVKLYTHVVMAENQRLYERRGYVETHRGRDSGRDRVFYEKRL